MMLVLMVGAPTLDTAVSGSIIPPTVLEAGAIFSTRIRFSKGTICLADGMFNMITTWGRVMAADTSTLRVVATELHGTDVSLARTYATVMNCLAGTPRPAYKVIIGTGSVNVVPSTGGRCQIVLRPSGQRSSRKPHELRPGPAGCNVMTAPRKLPSQNARLISK